MLESIRVAVIGSCNVDLNCYLEKMPAAGETVIGNDFETRMGGKGANQAVAAARFGSNVAFIGAVGNDGFGELILSNFGIEGIHHEHTQRVDGATGVAQIWIAADGENRIVVISGANAQVDAETAGMVAAYPALRVVLGQLEISQAATAAGFKLAKNNGAATVLNPAPYQDLLPELLELSDWLIVNEVEFSQLHQSHSEPTDEAIAELAQDLGCNVVVTLGAAGAALAVLAGAENSPVLVKKFAAPKVRAIDTVGAGDCFAGSFAHALAHKMAPELAVQIAVAASAQSVQRRGAQSSFPNRNEADAILKKLALT